MLRRSTPIDATTFPSVSRPPTSESSISSPPPAPWRNPWQNESPQSRAPDRSSITVSQRAFPARPRRPSRPARARPPTRPSPPVPSLLLEPARLRSIPLLPCPRLRRGPRLQGITPPPAPHPSASLSTVPVPYLREVTRKLRRPTAPVVTTQPRRPRHCFVGHVRDGRFSIARYQAYGPTRRMAWKYRHPLKPTSCPSPEPRGQPTVPERQDPPKKALPVSTAFLQTTWGFRVPFGLSDPFYFDRRAVPSVKQPRQPTGGLVDLGRCCPGFSPPH